MSPIIENTLLHAYNQISFAFAREGVVYFASQHFGAKSQQKQKTDLVTAVRTARFAPAVEAAT
jgi:hypothetical protein